MRQGAEGIECDLRLCASGELVLCHDARLDRLAGLPLAVAELPYAELAGLPILRDRFPSVEATIPTLEDAVAAGGRELHWNLELKVAKGEDSVALAMATAREVATLGLEGRVLVSSFDPLALLTLRRHAPWLPTAFLWSEARSLRQRIWTGFWARLCSSAAVHPAASVVDEGLLRRWHRRGLAVNVWTVDEAEELRRLAALGVDGVITNLPRAAREALEAV